MSILFLDPRADQLEREVKKLKGELSVARRELNEPY